MLLSQVTPCIALWSDSRSEVFGRSERVQVGEEGTGGRATKPGVIVRAVAVRLTRAIQSTSGVSSGESLSRRRRARLARSSRLLRHSANLRREAAFLAARDGCCCCQTAQPTSDQADPARETDEGVRAQNSAGTE